MNDLTVVIVNYNGSDFLGRALRRLLEAQCPPRTGVVLVDNASSDDSLEHARAALPRIRIIRNRENLGFARAVNQGIRAESAHYYLLLNSDTEVRGAAIRELWEFLARVPDAGIAAPRLVYADGRDQRTARRFPSPVNALFGRHSFFARLFPNSRVVRDYMPALGDEEAVRVDWVSGACLMIKDQTVKEIGLLDERFFMYWEDADWCFRAKRHGWNTYALPAIEILHHEGGSSGRMPSRLVWEFHRSVLHFYSKNYLSGRGGVLYLGARLVLFTRAALVIGLNALRKVVYRENRVARTVAEPTNGR